MHFVHDVTSSVKYETTVLRLLTVCTLNTEAAKKFSRNNKVVGKLFTLAALSCMCGCIVKHGITLCIARKTWGHVMY